MKTALILVGKTVNKHLQACVDDYVERLGHYMPFELVGIPELKNTKNLSEEQQKEQEGELILKQLQAQDYLVLLDEHGKELPYGFSPAVYRRCNEQLSLSKMTFSHQMVRMIFVEQLYRACTIIKGEPYHHE